MRETLSALDYSDYAVMGFNNSRDTYLQIAGIVRTKMPVEYRHLVSNVIHRLHDSAWIVKNVSDEMKQGYGIGQYEGLLSNAFYLLLTCADTLGHLFVQAGGAKKRFASFFQQLSTDEQNELLKGLHVWKTNKAELIQLGYWNPATNAGVGPNAQQILNVIQQMSHVQRLEATIDYLYQRRNSFTHEAEFPQLGFHPNLSVLLGVKLKIPNVGTVPEMDGLQVHWVSDDEIYFTDFVEYPIELLRRLVLKTVGRILRDADRASTA